MIRWYGGEVHIPQEQHFNGTKKSVVCKARGAGDLGLLLRTEAVPIETLNQAFNHTCREDISSF